MKKYLLIIFAAIVAIAFPSCAEKEIVTFHPGDLTAPELSNLSESQYVLTDGGAFADFNFSQASVGLSASIQYELFAVLAGDDAKPKSLGKVTNKESITVDANTLNNVLIGLGCAPDVAVAVSFYVTANWMSQSNKAVGYPTTSNIISANVTPFYAEKTYPKVYVIGTYNEWKHENDTYLYNYKDDDIKFEGVVDFGYFGIDHSGNAFKITGVPNWDDPDQNWGVVEKNTEPKDPATIQMISGGSSQDIANYQTYRYYYFSFNKSTLVLSKDFGFDQMGLIGFNGNWDDDIVMTWNPWKSRWYVDVDAASATEFKFRLDAGWDNNWGGSEGACVKGGDNISIESGQYRIYFYMNEMKYTIDANMYGKEEPGKDLPPEPPAEPVWSVIGEVGGTAWDTDFNMTNNLDGTWSVTTSIEGQFKLRYAADWGENRGAEGDEEPVTITLDTPTTVVAGGKNFTVPEPGTYKVDYDSNNETITVSNMGNKWSLIGEVNGSGWDKDFFMTEADGVWTSEAVTFANANGEAGSFKIRFNTSWDDANTRGASEEGFVFEVGTEFEVVSPGQNIKAPSATDQYIVTFVPETNKVTISMALPQDKWSLIGGVEGTGWDKDFYMSQDPTGAWISDPITITGGFKIRFNNDWGVNRGGTMEGLGYRFAVTQDGANIELATYDVKYQVVYYPDLEQVCVNPCTDGWSVIGSYNGHGWDYDLVMSYREDPNIWVSDIFFVAADGEVKIRQNCAWDADRGGTFAAIGEPFEVSQGGPNIKIGKEGYYYMTYDVAAETITVNYAWSVIGQVNGSGWDKDFWLRKHGKDTFESASFIANGGFKIRAAGAWDVDRGGVFAEYGTPFTAVQGGANIELPTADANVMLVYDSSAETITVTAVE